MISARYALRDDLETLLQMPGWITSGRPETPETAAFRSGVELTMFDQLVGNARYGVPVKPLANRLALIAATAASKLEGRLAREVDIHDAYHSTPPGEARGPDGDLLDFWREAVRFRLSGPAEIADLIGPDRAEDVVGWLNAGQERARTHGPLAGCFSVLQAAHEAGDRAERVACLLSDTDPAP